MVNPKIGDKVCLRYLSNGNQSLRVGNIYVIEYVFIINLSGGSLVSFSECERGLYETDQLSPVIRNSKLARKLYPKASEDGKWLILKRTM